MSWPLRVDGAPKHFHRLAAVPSGLTTSGSHRIPAPGGSNQLALCHASLRNVGCNSELNLTDLRHVDDFRRFPPGQAHRHAVIDRISVRLHNRRTDETGSPRADNTPKSERQGYIDMDLWYQVAALSVGGVLGVNARYWLGGLINRWAGSQFPWATFTINITGSFAIGLCTVFLARWAPHAHARLVVVVGFLGGYTTFSSYSFESLALWERGERHALPGLHVWKRCRGFCGCCSRNRTWPGTREMTPDSVHLLRNWFSSRMPSFSTTDIMTRNDAASARSLRVDTRTELAIAAIAHNQSATSFLRRFYSQGPGLVAACSCV